MGLVDPVKIYYAKSNIESEMVCRLLQSRGVEAFAGEDNAIVGIWWGGTVPGIFDACVFVSRADGEQAAEIIREYQQLEVERATAEGSEIEAVCEECGKTSKFSALQRGTVQSCPHCSAYFDVGEVDFPDGDEMGSEDGAEDEAIRD